MRDEICGVRVRDEGQGVRDERLVMWKERRGNSVEGRWMRYEGGGV